MSFLPLVVGINRTLTCVRLSDKLGWRRGGPQATGLQGSERDMDNDVDAVVLACRGTLASWSLAVEEVAYEQARVNAESPLDRGAALRRRVEEPEHGRRRHPVARGRVRAARRRAGLAAGHDRLRVPQPCRRARAALRRRPGGARGRGRRRAPPRRRLPGGPCARRGRAAPPRRRVRRDPHRPRARRRRPRRRADRGRAMDGGRPAPAAVRQRLPRRGRPRRDARDAPGVGQPHQRRAAPAAAPARRGVAQPARAGSVPGRGLSDASGRGSEGG